MKDELTVYDYAQPIYKVLLTKKELFGIGIIPAMAIAVLTIVLMNTVSVWCLIVGVVLFLVAKIVTKKDSYMMKILFERLMQPNTWRC